MNYKALGVLVFFILSGCATVKDPVDTVGNKQLITRDDYEDLQLKDRRKEPVEVNYAAQGTGMRSIETHSNIDPAELNQQKFINAGAHDPVEALKMYYENGARVNFRNNQGETALIKVLDGPYDNETLNKLEYLISVGAKLNFKGKSSATQYTTPLGVAIWNSSRIFKSGDATRYPSAREVLEVLLENGADVSGLEANGRTPLHLAVETDNLFAAQLLLEAGASVMVRDGGGNTPLDLAGSDQMEELLVEYGR